MFSNLVDTVKELQHTAFSNDSLVEKSTEEKELAKMIKNHNIYLQKDGMKHIISKMQRNEDCIVFYSDVMRMSDTKDPSLKRMINHYFSFYSKTNLLDDQMIIERTKSLLKDLSDQNDALICSALDILIVIHDISTFPTFATTIRKLMSTKSAKVQIRILTLFSIFICQDQHFLMKNELVECVIHVFRTSTLFVQTCAAKCINRQIFKFFRSGEIFNYFTQIINLPQSNTLFYSIDIVTRIIEENIDRFTVQEKVQVVGLLVEMMSYNAFTGICVGNLLLKIEPDKYQLIFDKVLLYMHTNSEELFHILVFLHDLIALHPTLRYSNTSFAIFYNDPCYVKNLKIEILKCRVDKHSINEILTLKKDRNFLLKILGFCMEHNVPDKDVIIRCFNKFRSETIKIIEFYQPDLDEWKVIINELLKETRISEDMTYLVGNYYEGLLSDHALKEFDSQARMNIIINYYTRKIISRDVLIKELDKIADNENLQRFEVDIVLKMVREDSIERLIRYINPQLHCISRKRTFENACSHSKISGLKPFEMVEQTVLEANNLNCVFTSQRFKESPAVIETGQQDKKSENAVPNKRGLEDGLRYMDISLESGKEIFSSVSLKRDESPIFEILEQSAVDIKCDEDHLIFLKSINNICFTAKVMLNYRCVILVVSKIARPFKIISNNLENTSEMIISDADEYIIGSLDIPKPFSLKINQLYGYYVNVNCKMCISPYSCTQEMFDKSYERINYSLSLSFDRIRRLPVHLIDKIRMVFRVMGVAFYGKVSNDNLVLKCSDRPLLERFVEENNLPM